MLEPSDRRESRLESTRTIAREVLLSRPALAVLGVLALSTAVELVPGLESLRLFGARPSAGAAPVAGNELGTASAKGPAAAASFVVGEARLPAESRGRAALAPAVEQRANARGPIPLEKDEGAGPIDKEPKVPVVDPTGRALDGFFVALERTRKKEPGAITRIAHFGDSIVVSDYVSATLRRSFQQRFGDAGHGFSLIANAWPAYSHSDVERYATAGWEVSRIVGPLARDGLYGLGCVSFSADRNVLARFGTAPSGDFGRAVSRFQISYLAQPGGGAFQVSVDSKPQAMVETDAPVKEPRVHELSVPDGAHELELYTKRGRSRLFGVVMEREGPGVVLDAIGIQGARLRFLDQQDDQHWAEQLRWRKPNLLIYQFGANESGDGFLYPMTDYRRTMEAVIEQGQRALPESSCLLIGAMDRAAKRGDELIGIAVIPHLLREQRGAAEARGCAFFDTYAAMGGPGSMAAWVKRELGQADLTHPTADGANVIGTWIFRALMKRYRERLETGALAGASNSAPNSSAPSR
jgi:lysophospholipase L1-like esterase